MNAELQDFDLLALKTALDTHRATLGLSWNALATELGISAATLRTLGERSVAEGDGVLRVVAWLGRSIESFVPGHPGDSHGEPLPAPAGALRFDAAALYAALDAERVRRGLTWRELALASGVGSHAILMRLRQGGRVMFPQVMRAFLWLGTPAAQFVRVTQR